MLTLTAVKELADASKLTLSDLEALLMTLQSEDEELRAWVTDCLQSAAELPSGSGELLSALVRHESPAVAVWACKLIARSADLSQAEQEALTRGLRESDVPLVRQEAARALGKASTLITEARTALEEACTSPDSRLERIAMESLVVHKT